MSLTDCEVYVYDLEGCKHEGDDPLDSAVLYSNRPDNPEHVLIVTGQLMGVAQFGLQYFGFPTSITLQNGAQFRLLQHGRFVLLLGEVAGSKEGSRVQELGREILESLKFFRGVRGLNKWFEESPCMFKRRLSRFLDAVLRNAASRSELFMDPPNSEVLERSISVLAGCMEACQGVLCGCLVMEDRVLYQNCPRRVFKKLQVLLNEKEGSLDTSFCKVYEESSPRLPLIGLDVFSIFISPEEVKELRHAQLHFLSQCRDRIKKSPMEEISDAIRLHNISRTREKSSSQTASLGFILLVVKVDLLRLLLIMETKSDKDTNLQNIKRIWSVGFSKLPKFIDMPGLNKDNQ